MKYNQFGEWDEFRILKGQAAKKFKDLKKKQKEDEEQRKKREEETRKFIDYILFVLCMLVLFGWEDAEETVGKVDKPDGLDTTIVTRTIKKKTIIDRLIEIFEEEESTEDDLEKVLDTEAHRDYNEGVYEAAKRSGVPVYKVWNTMLDDRVRDQHQYLEGVTVGIDDYFYTYTGAMALYPGGFGEPENDINCRCYITLTTVE